MKKLLTIFLLFTAAVSCMASSNKEEMKNDKLVVAMELQYPPFEMSDESGNPTGISPDIAKALGEYLGKEVVIENISWTGLIPSLQTNKADIIISSMTITEERAESVDFSDPYIRAGLSLLIAKDSAANTFSDLNKEGVVVAVKSGTIGAKKAQDELPLAEVRLFDEVAACVLEVSQGKADAFIYDPLTVFQNYKRNENSTRVNLASIEGTDSFWGMAIKKGNPELLTKVNAFIKEYQDKDSFNKLGDKYLGDFKAIFDENNIPFFFDIK